MNASTSANDNASRETVEIYRLGGSYEANSARALLAVGEEWMESTKESMPETKVIWLPACETYPMHWLQQSGEDRRLAGRVLQKDHDGPGRKLYSFGDQVSKRTFDVLLNQARARCGRKMLPAFKISRTTSFKQFHVGSGELTSGSLWSSIRIAVDEISGLSEAYDGSYAIVLFTAATPTKTRTIIDPDNNTASVVIAREAPGIIGKASRVGDTSPWGYYHSLSKNVSPEFPW